MIPIHALLARIRHDPQFGRGKWEIAYLDRVRASLVRVPLDEVRTQAHIGFVFEVTDEDGIARSVPYHRVRQVWRDGKIVWSRMQPRQPARAEKLKPARRRVMREARIRR